MDEEGLTWWHGWVLHPPPFLLVSEWWKCQQRRKLSKRHRGRQKNSGRRRRHKWLKEKEKPWEWGASVKVGGKRGAAGGINTSNVNHRHLAEKEREVETETWDIRRCDRVGEWMSKTKVDRMMEKLRSRDTLMERAKSHNWVGMMGKDREVNRV